MPRSLSDPLVRTLAKPHRADLTDLRAGKANLRIDANSLENAEQKRGFLQLVRDAMREADLSQKAFAVDAQQSESVISEALSGGRHLSADWLYAQNDGFLLALMKGIERARHLTPESKAALRANRISELIRLLLEVA